MRNTALRATAAALAAVAGGIMLATPASADTYTANKIEKAVVFASLAAQGTTASSACYTVTFSDKYKNWMMIQANLEDGYTARGCNAFDGVIFYKRTSPADQWEWVDSGDRDLVMGVPGNVVKEFLPSKP